MKNFKSFAAAMKHEIGEKGYESERGEGHGDMKGHPSVKQIAHKHNITPEEVVTQVKKGYKLEKEHTSNIDIAIDIALQHVNEFPTYYDELIKMETSLKKKHSKFKDNKIQEALGDRKFCSLCGKHEYEQECSYGPEMWKKYSIATVHPANEEAKHGLYYNVNQRKKKGLPPKKSGQEGYPTAKAWKDSAKTAKNEETKFSFEIKKRKSTGITQMTKDDAERHSPQAAALRKKAMGKISLPMKEESDTLLSFTDFMQITEVAAWQKKAGKNPEGGLNEKGRKSYEAEHPGSNLQAPQPQGGPRKRSFCARMGGMPGPMKDDKGRPTRKALSLRKWKC